MKSIESLDKIKQLGGKAISTKSLERMDKYLTEMLDIYDQMKHNSRGATLGKVLNNLPYERNIEEERIISEASNFIDNLVDKLEENAKEIGKLQAAEEIDEELLKDRERFRKMFTKYKTTSKIETTFSLPLTPSQKLKIRDVLDKLQTLKMIDEKTTVPQFKAMLTGGTFNDKINWIGTYATLSYFVQKIKGKKKIEIACRCFTVKGNVITPEQLKNNNKPKKGDVQKIDIVFSLLSL